MLARSMSFLVIANPSRVVAVESAHTLVKVGGPNGTTVLGRRRHLGNWRYGIDDTAKLIAARGTAS